MTFGSYEQDNDLANGKEPIEWIVLDVQDGKSLLISKYGLDCQRYNTLRQSVTWETCSLRRWLNNTFLYEAFDAEELARIPATAVTADKNPSYNTDQGNDTSDRVFLLSVLEANEYFSSDEARLCIETAFCKANGYYTYIADLRPCVWWLRSLGNCSYDATVVTGEGFVGVTGIGVQGGNGAVRPVIWVSWE